MNIDIKTEKCDDVFNIPFYDCDYKKRIKISTILKILAQLAGKDYTDRGLGHEFLWENGYVFLVSRISIKIKRYVSEPEVLNISTWECGKKGAMFLRAYQIKEQGEVCIDGMSGWVVANPITRKIIRPNVFPWIMPQLDSSSIDANPIDKITLSDGKKVDSHKVQISDLDANGHVYNANYADIALNSLPKEDFEKDIDNFRINYVNEAVLGEVIDIYREDIENGISIVGKIQEKICFETEILYKK